MIDNRPKVHHVRKSLPAEKPSEPAAKPEGIHIAAVEAAAPIPSEKPAQGKAAHSKRHGMSLGGLLGGKGSGGLLGGKGLGGLLGGKGSGGLLGGKGLGGLLGGLGGGSGGGLGSILPLILVVSALQNNGRGSPLGGLTHPASKPKELPAIPVEAAHVSSPAGTAVKAAGGNQGRSVQHDKPAAPAPSPTQDLRTESRTGLKQRTQLKAEKKPPDEPKPQDPEPVAAAAAQRRPAPKPAPRPAEIKNLLNDLSGYLPGSGGPSVAKISRIIGIADELKSLDSSPGLYASAAVPQDPLSRHIGLLNVLGRNLPMGGSSNLGKASQVLSLVSTLSGSGGQNLNGMAGMLRSAMAPSQGAAQEMKNITPQQADGIKDTVNRLLSGMDDKQKNELLDKAKDFLGKK